MDRLISDLKESELRALIRSVVEECGVGAQPQRVVRWVKGIQGLRDTFRVGTNQAVEIKKSGVINAAIIQTGPHSFKTDAEMAERLWKEHTDRIRQGIR